MPRRSEELLDPQADDARLLHLAFPDDQAGPPHVAQRGDVLRVALHVARELRRLIVDPGLRNGREVATVVAVPVTSMQPNDLPSCGEHEVGRSGQSTAMHAEPVSGDVDQRSQGELQLGVLAPIGAHGPTNGVSHIRPTRSFDAALRGHRACDL